jgi:SPP1 gp7 family putative phage head morphogenesis protein
MADKTKVKILRPIKDDPALFDKIEKRIKEVFRGEIYLPLLKEFKISKRIADRLKIKNASDMRLIEALADGLITYSEGAFRGQFDARTSKELRKIGAKWDRKTSTYRLAETELPSDVRYAISATEVAFRDKLKKIDDKLAKILPEEIAEKIKTADIFDQTLWKADQDFQKTLANITVPPQLTKERRAKIADEWQNNMDLWIKNFTEKEIKELRKTVMDSIFAGNRYESLVKGIQSSYNVTTRKAKFLARQETNLLLAKFKESRYTDAGVHEYIWGCVHMPKDKSPKEHVPGNVRYMHGLLEGKKFRWDDPPITTNPGEPVRRNNPGQDYNCRCFARPIVRFKEE